jgi:DNA-binding NtrC family response regulator
MSMGDGDRPKFPDSVPPTKVFFRAEDLTTLHLRRCTLTILNKDGSQGPTQAFERGEIAIGAMDDNDLVLRDDTVSRYHCRIVQEDSGYVLVDLRSTNGTTVNGVRVREAFLHPGCTVAVGKQKLKFNASEERVEVVPSQSHRLGGIIGQNERMRAMFSIIERIAPTSSTVVIEGETGTGKEVVAQTFHDLSPRAKGELIVFDCGAVPPNLVESELFGHEKGSFTGAVMTRQGLFELADGGTLFLDELGELPLDLQPKLLRALETREVRRVGSSKPIRVDVRIIAATNRKLESEVRAGRFRQDLFYRLSVVRIQLPALRERRDDIPLLVQNFIESRFGGEGRGGIPVTGCSASAMQALQAYQWPGNVRELVNVVERAVSFCDGDTIQIEHLPEHFRSGIPRPEHPELDAMPEGSDILGSDPPRPSKELVQVPFKDAKEKWVSSFERDYIVSLLKRHGGNISHAAREADIDRKYFRKLMKKYEIDATNVTE